MKTLLLTKKAIFVYHTIDDIKTYAVDICTDFIHSSKYSKMESKVNIFLSIYKDEKSRVERNLENNRYYGFYVSFNTLQDMIHKGVINLNTAIKYEMYNHLIKNSNSDLYDLFKLMDRNTLEENHFKKSVIYPLPKVERFESKYVEITLKKYTGNEKYSDCILIPYIKVKVNNYDSKKYYVKNIPDCLFKTNGLILSENIDYALALYCNDNLIRAMKDIRDNLEKECSIKVNTVIFDNKEYKLNNLIINKSDVMEIDFERYTIESVDTNMEFNSERIKDILESI